ncbi:MAG: YDG domain-containing protein [Corallococcus sp.]|nr:YDG domain-containing protein [Corallococcus sp.]
MEKEKGVGKKNVGKNSKSAVKERSDTATMIMGIVASAIIVALVVAAVIFMVNSGRSRAGALQGETAMRMGGSQKLTLTVGDDDNVKMGDTVRWYVNGTRVHSSVYDGSDMEYEYVPQSVGVNHVRVEIGGKYFQSADIEVGKPLLTYKADDVSVEYGSEIPQLGYTVEGFIDGDDPTLFQSDCRAVIADYSKNVGVYKVTLENLPVFDKYDVEAAEGNLEITPKEIKVINSFVKQYDGTNQMPAPELYTLGALEEDEVTCECDTIYFDDKNVGADKKVTTYNFKLSGRDCANYYVCHEQLTGEITPKPITLSEVKIDSKVYDGTTKASVSSIGKLSGVVYGDIVEIGGCDARFTDAKSGKGKTVRIGDIILVGKDKDNYVIRGEVTGSADITGKYTDYIIQRPDVAQGAN